MFDLRFYISPPAFITFNLKGSVCLQDEPLRYPATNAQVEGRIGKLKTRWHGYHWLDRHLRFNPAFLTIHVRKLSPTREKSGKESIISAQQNKTQVSGTVALLIITYTHLGVSFLMFHLSYQSQP